MNRVEGMWSNHKNYDTLISVIQLKYILYVVALTLLFKYIIAKFQREHRFVNFAKTLPGPSALPIFGNSLSFILKAKDDPIAYQIECVRKYGPMYRMWIGKHLNVVMSDLEALQVIFQNSKTLQKNRIFIEQFQKFWGNGLITNGSVHEWKADRKRLQPFFTNDQINLKISVITGTIDKFIERIGRNANKAEFDIGNYIFHLCYDILTTAIFDHETQFDDKSVSDLQLATERSTTILSLMMFLPMLNSKLISYLADKFFLNSLKNNLLNGVRKTIAKNVSQLEKEGLNTTEISRKSLLSSSYKMRQETGNEMKMLEELLIIQMAGTESPAVIISFALLMIAMYPDIQEKLYAEICDTFGEDDRPADNVDIERLTYLDQVVKETQRRFTLVPVLFREAKEDIKIGSRVFPEGIGIMVDTASIHFNPKFYPEPFNFNPNNFSPEAVKNRPKYSFIPFSAGPRNCIGKYMAETETRLIIVALLRKFSLSTSMTMENLKVTFGFVIHNMNGYPLSIKERNSNT